MKFLLILSYLSILQFCKPADPNYRIKPLQNTEYTGFIARNFFQAVIEVPLTKEELPILEERKSCFKDAMKQRDKIVIPILKQIAMEDKWNEKERKSEVETLGEKDKEKIQKSKFQTLLTDPNAPGGITTPTNTQQGTSVFDKKAVEETKSKNPLLNRGEFSWFLDSMFIYKEDYSNPEKCTFIFRNIQPNLFERVEKTKLSVVGEDKKNTMNPNNTQNPNQTQTPGTIPTNTGLPQTIR